MEWVKFVGHEQLVCKQREVIFEVQKPRETQFWAKLRSMDPPSGTFHGKSAEGPRKKIKRDKKIS